MCFAPKANIDVKGFTTKLDIRNGFCNKKQMFSCERVKQKYIII